MQELGESVRWILVVLVVIPRTAEPSHPQRLETFLDFAPRFDDFSLATVPHKKRTTLLPLDGTTHLSPEQDTDTDWRRRYGNNARR